MSTTDGDLDLKIPKARAGSFFPALLERHRAVTRPFRVDGSESWSYMNIRGDVSVMADGAGVRTGVFSYDPFGQSIDPVSGEMGTVAADESLPDTC